MILWAIALCAAAGFFLGLQYRLLLLAMASALVAISLPLALHMGDALATAGPFATLGMIVVMLVVLQAFFLAGAVLRVSGPVSRPAGATLASPPASRTSGP